MFSAIGQTLSKHPKSKARTVTYLCSPGGSQRISIISCNSGWPDAPLVQGRAELDYFSTADYLVMMP